MDRYALHWLAHHDVLIPPPRRASPFCWPPTVDLCVTVFDRAVSIARSDATTLITGESGTGKGGIARFIHQRSSRARSTFVSVNCAGLSEGVIESELFGHERGAFIDALHQRPGRFEQVRDGTIFLDEIGAADARVQQRLLRVLQERCFERVGAT